MDKLPYQMTEEELQEHGRQFNEKIKDYKLPYPWCIQPEICKDKGCCPRGCGE